MNREPDEPNGPDPAADEFEAIVAGWRREGAVPTWPGEERPPSEPPRTPPFAAPPIAPAPAHRPYEPETDRFEHFIPPEPPPLPRIGPPAAVGITLLVLGLVLIIAPNLVGISNVYGLPLGLLALAAGLGWLVLRLWPAPPDERDEDDDGAQL
ncbi:MAG TPA: hypothetical protein VFY38_00730 [Pseudonocardia sp.]|nr:hypothetical protein [Pseudonocardia sp.]